MEKKIVYHYCSIDVFHKIITNHKIRLSEITKSNDSMELKWATQYIFDIFMEKYRSEAASTNYFFVNYPEDVYKELLEQYLDETFDDDRRYYSFYVCCFSEESDCLSQWRGYADDAKGVAIGFDANELKEMTNRLGSRYDMLFDAVVYSEYEQRNAIKKQAQLLIDSLKRLAKEVSEEKIDKSEVKEKSKIRFRMVFEFIFKKCVFLKNPFFKEEKEYRLCRHEARYVVDESIRESFTKIAEKETKKLGDTSGEEKNSDEENVLEKIEYYCRNSTLVPFFDMLFDKENAIKEVIIGPKCNATANDVETFLYNYGFCNVSVRKSAGTYR